MQRRVGRVVRPHFMRRRPGLVEVVAGVQRLAGDDDPYAWQDRGESPSQESMLGALGFTVAAGSALEGRRQREDEAWAHEFETSHAQHLHELRQRRYHELREEALREKQIIARREDEPVPSALDRFETLDLRGQLDDEMPWQFGFPEHMDAYPEPLPPEEEQPAGREGEHHEGQQHEGQQHETGHGEHHTARGHGAGLHAGAHAATGRRRLTTTHTGHGAGRGHRVGGPLGHGRGRATGAPGTHGGDAHDTQFDWQHRESTDHEVVEAMFGGGLFGGLLGLAVGADTDATRRQAEESTPGLHDRRRDKERELRHRALQTKHNEARRNDELDEATPIKLSHDEIVDIRQQLDQEMPLQYVTPEYLDQHDDAQMAADGTFSRAQTLAADEDDRAGADVLRHDAAHAPGNASVAGDTGAPSATDTATDAPAYESEAGATSGARGGGAIRTGLAAAAGAVIGHHLGDHHDAGQHEGAHNDSFAEDEEAAGRLFAAASDVDIDNLSRRMWSRIRREMRTELLVDRERAGSLADIR